MRLAATLISPVICIGLLTAVAAQDHSRIRPEDAEPYHARAKAAIESIPYQINGWCGQDDEIPAAASKLLRPNIILSRTYVDPGRSNRRAGLLIVQCKDARDMLGHYPPVCYPAHGMTQTSQSERDWLVGGLVITGMEYEFAQTTHEHEIKMTVCNFIVVPGVGIMRDMKGLLAAAANHQQRYFGAAQFQVTLSSDCTPLERQEIVATLLGPNVAVINTLKSGGLQ